VVALLRHAMDYRREPLIRFGVAAVFLIALSHMKMDHQFALYLGDFALSAARHANVIRPTWHLPLRLAVAAAINLITLSTYYL